MRLRLGHEKISTATRLAVASVTAVLLAGCSGDVTRFASNPFEMDQAPTSSIPQASVGPQAGFQSASVGAVDTSPLSSPAQATVSTTVTMQAGVLTWLLCCGLHRS